MFQQQDLQGLGSEARAAVLAFTSCVALINLLDRTESFCYFQSQKLVVLVTDSVLWKGEMSHRFLWGFITIISNSVFYS